MDIKPKHAYTPSIQILNKSDDIIADLNDQAMIDDDHDFNWDFPQSMPFVRTSSNAYGFNNMYKDLGTTIHQIAYEIIDFADLDNSTYDSRLIEQRSAEDDKFNAEYYQ
jgi:hypothetical protein